LSQPKAAPPKSATRRSRVVDYGVYLIARVLICVIQSLPLTACGQLARRLAFILHDVLNIRRNVIDENLRHAFPDLAPKARSDIARGMFEHLVLMICEIAHAPRKIHETNWRDYCHLVGKRHLVRAMLEPRALVAVTAHHGNFEINGYIAGLLGFPTFTLARTLDNPYLHRFLSEFREVTGQFVLPTKHSASLAEYVIESNETLAALADHYAGPKGCWIEFFHRPASCHKAIALFALSHRVPLVVLYTKRDGAPLRFQLEFVAKLDPACESNLPMNVKQITEWYTQIIENFVRETPQQYWWLHRRWKDTRATHRARRLRRKDLAEASGQPTARTHSNDVPAATANHQIDSGHSASTGGEG
jgi:KDO2-lipid IV(A) lauroyltransferase